MYKIFVQLFMVAQEFITSNSFVSQTKILYLNWQFYKLITIAEVGLTNLTCITNNRPNILLQNDKAKDHRVNLFFFYQQMIFLLLGTLMFLQSSTVGSIKTTESYWTLKPNGLYLWIISEEFFSLCIVSPRHLLDTEILLLELCL